MGTPPSSPQYWANWSTISTALTKGEEENDLFTQDAGLDIAGWKEGEVVDEDRLADQVAVVDVHAHLDRGDDVDEDGGYDEDILYKKNHNLWLSWLWAPDKVINLTVHWPGWSSKGLG